MTTLAGKVALSIALLVATFYSGVMYQQGRQAKIEVKVLQADARRSAVIEERAHERESRTESEIETIVTLEAPWASRPLPDSVVEFLRVRDLIEEGPASP